MKSKFSSEAMIKLSLESLQILSPDLQQSRMFIKADNHGREPITLTFTEQSASIMKYFTFAANPQTIISIKVIAQASNQVLGQCEFCIKNFSEYPQIRHCLEINLVKKSNQEIVETSVGKLKAQLLYLVGNIGILSCRVVKMNISMPQQQVAIFIENNSNQIKTGVDQLHELMINASDPYLRLTLTASEQEVIGFKEVEMYEEGILKPKNQYIQRHFYLMHNGQTVGNIVIQSKFAFSNCRKTQQNE